MSEISGRIREGTLVAMAGDMPICFMTLGAATLTADLNGTLAMASATRARFPRAAQQRAEREHGRVARHIAGAERGARHRGVVLDRFQTSNRSLLLDELARYRRRGRFPINGEFTRSPAPVFVDPYGTRCAVGHLLEISGQGALVRFIARTRNNARVRELAALPELRAWLTAAGLSVDEAARIQPEYCFLSEADACFCQSSNSRPVALGTIVTATPASGQLVVRFERIEGDLTGIQVGDERPAIGEGRVGDPVLLVRPSEEIDEPWSVEGMLPVRDGQVYCQVNRDTARRPVSIDTAIEALRTEGGACIEVLASDDSLWNRSQCEGGSGGGELDATQGPAARRVVDDSDGGGCALSPVIGFGAAELTSAALFAALIARRWIAR